MQRKKQKQILFVVIVSVLTGFIFGNFSSANAGGSISGKVTSIDGQSLADIWVDASSGVCGVTWRGSGKTDNNGNYLINLPAGEYCLSTGDTSGIYIDEWWNNEGGSGNCNEAEVITVFEGQSASGINFQLKGKGNISGKITSNDGQPISGVKVDASDLCSTSFYGSNTTASDGTYLISDIPEGSYYISTYNKSYPGKWWNSGEGTTDCTKATQITVIRSQTTADINFKLSTCKISGIITTDSGQPIAGVRVEASSDCGETVYEEGITDTGGTYLISGIVPGIYYISAYDDNKRYISKWWKSEGGVTDCKEAGQITVTEDQTLPDINLSLDEAGKISVTVTSDSGQPIPEIQVNASGLCGETWYGGGTTNASGMCIISGLPADIYYISTYDEHKNYVDEWWDNGNGTNECKKAEQVNVSPGQTVSVQIPLAGPGKISGKICTAGGQPLADISVNVWSLCNGAWYGGGTSGSTGTYLISGLSPDSYYISAYDGKNIYAGEWWDKSDGTADCKKAIPVAVATGQTTFGVDFMLDKGGTVSGTVSFSDGRSDIWVRASSLCGETLYGRVQTDTSGNYAVSRLPEDKYYISTEDLAYKYSNIWWDGNGGTGDCNEAAPVSVITGQTISGINFSLSESAGISGKISDEEGNPVANVCVDAREMCSEKWYGIGGKTDDKGFFLISGLSVGTYYIFPNVSCDIQQNYVNKWWNNADGTIRCDEAAPVTVISGQVTPYINFQLNKGKVISGKVFSNSGSAVPNIKVNAWDTCREHWYGEGTTDTDGNYLISGLSPGDYYIFTDASGDNQQNYIDEWWNSADGTSDCKQAVAVSVIAGLPADNIDFILNEGGMISGKVTASDDGQPVSGVCVGIAGNLCGKPYKGSETDEDGIYLISGISQEDCYLITDASCRVRQNYIDEWWNGGDGTANCNEASIVTVTAGTITSGKNFSLKSGEITQTVPTVPNWNWISFNTFPENKSLATVLNAYAAKDNDVIKTSVDTATYHGGIWYGLSGGIKPGVMYLLKNQSSSPGNLTVKGYPVNVSDGINILPGWNWIGFKPQNGMYIAAALNSLKSSDNDIIKTAPHLGGTATYYAGQWWPADYTLHPGVGYLLKSALSGILIYPDSGKSRRSDGRFETRSVMKDMRSSPDWENPTGMQHTITIHAEVQLDSGEFIDTDGSKLAAFKNDECRGVIPITPGPSGKWFQLTVASNEAAESDFMLKIYDADTEAIYDIKETFDFAADEITGNISDPVIYTVVIRELTLADAVTVLKDICGSYPYSENIKFIKDIDGDGKIGLAEVIHILQKVSSLR